MSDGWRDETIQAEQLQLVNCTKLCHGMVSTKRDCQVAETMEIGVALKRKHLDENLVGILPEPNSNRLKLALSSPKVFSHAYEMGPTEGVFPLGSNGTKEGRFSHALVLL